MDSAVVALGWVSRPISASFSLAPGTLGLAEYSVINWLKMAPAPGRSLASYFAIAASQRPASSIPQAAAVSAPARITSNNSENHLLAKFLII